MKISTSFIRERLHVLFPDAFFVLNTKGTRSFHHVKFQEKVEVLKKKTNQSIGMAESKVITAMFSDGFR